MDTTYIGEHLLPGRLGHFLVVLSFVSSIVATIAYMSSTRAGDPEGEPSWRRIGRGAFLTQVVGILGVFALLSWILFHHYFEYAYVWQYTNRDLPFKFLLSSLWNGQEGSFLLWAAWNCVLGTILLFSARRWEAPVMTVMSFAQVCLASMVLGIYIFGYKVGSNPFILFREDNPGMPLFANANYLQFLTDGRGLNPLLQNYWMTIHPPVLFCGFASTIIPFCFAVAGLWKKDYSGWVRPALPWALFSGMILGLGVMMGAAWAYESLSFGGFWAWDPVENASLVPWLTLVAGIHTLLAYRHTGHSLRVTFFLFLISFLLVLYSTFLTRSGILGETSVHAFTDLGMSGQLLAFLGVFLVAGFGLFFLRYRHIPALRKEEALSSREFWMFVGALVLLLSALFISFSTSTPVWNKLFNTNIAQPVDVKFHYNKVQVFIGVLVAMGTALIQYLRYRQTPGGWFRKKIWLPSLAAAVLAALVVVFGGIHYHEHGIGFLVALYLLLVASLYAVVANVGYIAVALKGRMRQAGASVAHAGFALMLVGMVISASNQTAISHDDMGLLDGYFPTGSAEATKSRENIYLPRHSPMTMGSYTVTYMGDSTAPKDPKRYYRVNYVKRDKQGRVVESFDLYPDAFINPQGQEGLIANPDAKRYWNKDIFTYVTSVFDPSKMDDTAAYKSYQVQPGDTIFFADGYIRLDRIQTQPRRAAYVPEPGDLAVGASLQIHDKRGHDYTAMPIYYLRDSAYQHYVEDTVPALALYLRFDKVLPEQKKIQLQVKQSGVVNDYIVMKAYVFPYINLVWAGVVVMIVGFAMSIASALRRLRRRRPAPQAVAPPRERLVDHS